jgi:XTP/dITP diphosphohydrolase
MGNQNRTKIILATRNVNKLLELREILNGLPLEIEALIDYPDIPEIEETGATFVENAVMKANAVFESTRILSIADDSGLEVDALNGAPGVRSARFAGNHHDYSANNRKLLESLENTPEEERGAQFRCVAAIIGPAFKEIMEGIVRGRIIEEAKGDKGFGYDPLFVPEGFDKTFAELGEEIKNRISHRALAFEKVKEVLRKMIYMPA